MKKVLIIQTAFIGDVILATSLIETLAHNLQGEVSIDILVRKGNEGLLENNPHVHKVWVWDKKQKKYKNLFQLIRLMRKTPYFTVYNLQRFGTTGFLTWRLKAERKVGFRKNPFAFSFSRKVAHEIGNGKHEVERNFGLIADDLPGIVQPDRPKLYPSNDDFEKVRKVINGEEVFSVLAPASVWFTKQLPEEKWIILLKHIVRKGPVYLIGAPGDSAFINQIIERSGVENANNLAGKLNLLQSAALIGLAKRTYVNDSAPLHLASAMNAPVTAFFCSTIPGFGFGPLSEDARVEETKIMLECRPCGLHGYKTCPKRHFKCGHEIDVLSGEE